MGRAGHGSNSAPRANASPMGTLLPADLRRTMLKIMRGQPEPLQVAPVTGLWITNIGGTPMQHVVIVDELHIPGRQLRTDVIFLAASHRADDLERFKRGARQTRRFGVALTGANVVGYEPHEETPLEGGKHRKAVERLGVLWLFATKII